MRKIFIFTMILLSITFNCLAAIYPTNMVRWKRFLVNDVCSSFIDSFNYHSFRTNHKKSYNETYLNHHIISTWQWIIYSDENILSLEPEQAYTLQHRIYDIDCNKITVKRILTYDKNGNCIHDNSYDDFVVDGVPNSIAEEELVMIDLYDTYLKTEK